jgi:DUF971 family protein
MHPESIRNDLHEGMLEIFWNGGPPQRFAHAFLRTQCKCADCKAWRLRTQSPLPAPEDIRIAEIRPVGAYGLQFVFSDGHERGIYPWAYLKDLNEAMPY